MVQALRNLRHDSTGTGALELALAMPILMLLLVGMVDASRLVAARLDAEQAAQRATDFALAKRPTTSNATYIKNEAVRASGLEAKDITAEIYLECNGTRQSDFRTVCPAGEHRARFVNVEIDRTVEFIFDWSAMAALFGSNVMGESIVVSGDSLVRFQ